MGHKRHIVFFGKQSEQRYIPSHRFKLQVVHNENLAEIVLFIYVCSMLGTSLPSPTLENLSTDIKRHTNEKKSDQHQKKNSRKRTGEPIAISLRVLRSGACA